MTVAFCFTNTKRAFALLFIATIVFFGSFTCCSGSLRGGEDDASTTQLNLQPSKLPSGEIIAKKDWDTSASQNGQSKERIHHGRDLQFGSSFDECVERLGSAYTAVCSCIFDDGNDAMYCVNCLGALANAQFSLAQTDRFSEWFTDSSTITLAQTGEYKGIDAITEYINFIYSEYFDNYTPVGNVLKVWPNPNFNVDSTCIVSQCVKGKLKLNPSYFDETCLATTIGSTIYFELTPDKENSVFDISKIYAFYFPEFFQTLFGGARAEDITEFLCGEIEKYCTDTWEFNNYNNNDNKCIGNVMSLNATEGDLAAIDGKSLGCKMLHGAFVKNNAFHCPHLSFKKQEDDNGSVKCQKTKGVSPESLFTNEMLEFFTDASDKFGFNRDLRYSKGQDCLDLVSNP